MKKKLNLKIDVSKIKYFFARYRKIFIILLCILLVSVIGAGSLYGYKMYKISISIEARIDKIKNAIALVVFEDLTSFIDFRQLSQNMAESIMQDPRSKLSNETTTTEVSESIQKSLLELFYNKEKKEPAEINVFTPLNIFPNNSLIQLTSSLKIVTSDDNEGIVEAIIKYERTNTEVAVQLQVENTESYGWRITKVLNPKQVLAHFFEAKQIIRDRVVDFVTEKNNMITKEMDKYFSIKSCTATVTTLSDNTTKLLIIDIQGHNNGPYIIFNFNINTSYYNAKTEKLVDTFSLNLARRVFPNEKFANVWNLEIDQSKPKHKILLDNTPLTCTAQFNNMTLSSGKILYTSQIPAEK